MREGGQRFEKYSCRVDETIITPSFGLFSVASIQNVMKYFIVAKKVEVEFVKSITAYFRQT